MHKNDINRPSPLDIAVALVLLTRLPLPRLSSSAFDYQSRATWAFAFAGVVVAACAALLGGAAMAIGLPHSIAAGVVLATQIIVTGAMHEDGLADTADGFWGGWDRTRRLEIMKDSAIGTYGILSLILSVGLRWSALTLLLPEGFAAIFAAAILSRAILPVFMAVLPHARVDGLSHSVGKPPIWAVASSVGLGVIAGWFCLGGALFAVLCALIVTLVPVAALARAKIGGQTGDVLGAAQQTAECTVLIVLVAMQSG